MLVARTPLHDLSMSALQSGSRRSSARIQEKEATQSASVTKQNHVVDGYSTASSSRKRKAAYEEEQDGFTFTRVRKIKKARPSHGASTPVVQTAGEKAPTSEPTAQHARDSNPAHEGPRAVIKGNTKKRMSFSTPGPKPIPVRRSKRLSADGDEQSEQPSRNPDEHPAGKRERSAHDVQHTSPAPTVSGKVQVKKNRSRQEAASEVAEVTHNYPDDDSHASAKIVLPFADTPVIRRNKAMREGRIGKGGRRSSLGLRGRRASSLLLSGTSNALPHAEVAAADFYKHIESGELETRRMRLLLTWCATRALHSKPQGTDFEDASVRAAARIIEEELLDELSNKAELSDWLTREDEPTVVTSIPERPNPKNVQNARKVTELEQHIHQLRSEKEALERLLRPPAITEYDWSITNSSFHTTFDKSLLSEDDARILDSLYASSTLGDNISARLGQVTLSLRQSIDIFGDGIHAIAQYRQVSEHVADQMLATCAERFSEREREGRRKALQMEEYHSPNRDLTSVLRGLSRADR